MQAASEHAVAGIGMHQAKAAKIRNLSISNAYVKFIAPSMTAHASAAPMVYTCPVPIH